MPDVNSKSKVKRGDPEHCARNAAQLELFSPRQGWDSFEEHPLEIGVTLGDQVFSAEDGLGFRLEFRRVLICLFLKNCSLGPRYRYERTLPSEEFSHFLKRIFATNKSASAKGSIGVTERLSSILSLIGLDAQAQVDLEASLKSDSTSSYESKIKYEIVKYIANNRWEIGRSGIGDPNQMSSNLRGRYLHLDGDDPIEKGFSPLCVLQPKNKNGYSATVEIRAKLGDCVYTPLQDNKPAKVSTNKKRIEAAVVAKALQQQTNDPAFDPEKADEVILARAEYSVTRSK